MNENERKVKRYSVVAVVVLCAVLSSMLVMRQATKRMARDLLHIPATQATTDAAQEITNAPDPRFTLPTEESTQATTQAKTEKQTEEPRTTTSATTKATTSPAPQKAATTATTAPTTTKGPTSAAAAAATVKNTHFILPIEGAKATKTFAPDTLQYSETMQDWRTHNGVDFAAEKGAKVLSIGNGTVRKVSSDPRWGYTIEIDYGAFTARYCALSQEDAVGIDDEVHTGDVIGTLADIPLESAEAPHLHFEVLREGALIDPMQALGIQ